MGQLISFYIDNFGIYVYPVGLSNPY